MKSFKQIIFFLLLLSSANLITLVHADSSFLNEELLINKPSALARESDKFLKRFQAGQAVTLFDSKPFLVYELSKSLDKGMDSKTALFFDTMHQELTEYYARTHQKGGFEELEVAARQSVFLTMIQNPELLKELNQKLCEGKDTVQIRQYIQLCQQVLNDIKLKNNEQPSIHGHPRDLFNEKDLKIIKAIKQNRNYPAKLKRAEYPRIVQAIRSEAKTLFRLIRSKLKEADQELAKYSSLFATLENLDIEKIQNQSSTRLSNNEVKIVLEAKASLMNINLAAGRNFELSFLVKSQMINPEYKTGLQNLLALDDIHGESIDLALLKHIIDEHNQASVHPKVAVEGGGPTGLLMAITQFQAGADVTLFEKRSTFYDRTQIVRLDPKWMSILKFYLGEEYYHLFEGENHRGVIRPDAFGEIATAFLEEALHNQLTKLISMLKHAEGKIPPMERLAAYEMVRVEAPKEEGQRFRIVAEYNKDYDPSNVILDSEFNLNRVPPTQTIDPCPEQIEREIDAIICAGGKSSPMKEKFLSSSIAVTEQKYYGVSSWLAQPIAGHPYNDVHCFPGQNPSRFDMFQDFRGMVYLDESFRINYLNKLFDDFNHEDFHYLEDTLKDAVLDFLTTNEALSDFIANGPQEPYVQTRTFENYGLIYVGMEVPGELKNVMGSIDQKLTKIVDLASAEDKKPLKIQKELILKHFQHAWFQNVISQYGMDQKHGLSMDKLDKKFSTLFNVDQNRLHHDHFFSHIEKGSSHLFVAAAGDANNSPHFMRYSGLTGAREDILGLQKWTKGMAFQNSDRDQKALEAKLIEDWERTAEFVISRGKAFLKLLSDDEVAQNRKAKLTKILDLQIAETANASHNYQVLKDKHGQYAVHFGGNIKTIIPQEDGSFHMGGKNYESFAQIKLENDLI